MHLKRKGAETLGIPPAPPATDTLPGPSDRGQNFTRVSRTQSVRLCIVPILHPTLVLRPMPYSASMRGRCMVEVLLF